MSSVYESEKQHYRQYLCLIGTGRSGRQEEVRITPLFSLAVKHIDSSSKRCNSSCSYSSSESFQSPEEYSDASSNEEVLPQYGPLGHHVGDHMTIGKLEPVLLNVNAPKTAFICGSQGSGKSYTLSCMLENCRLLNQDTGKLISPVAGVVFHYDMNSTTSIAEAAHLCSSGIKANVYVSNSNERALKQAYSAIDKTGNLNVKPLLPRSSDLSIERMHKLMAVADKEGPVPLYMEGVQRILRQMAITDTLNYTDFKALLRGQAFSKDQTSPMNLRLGLLESSLDPRDISSDWNNNSYPDKKPKPMTAANGKAQLFDLSPGTLTIIDLSDTFIDFSTVCMLFKICLGLIKEQRPSCGLAIALDEAHKYMNKSTGATNFTNRLLTTIREQRHNGSRVIIATQESTISGKLLHLCSVSMSIVHRFTSPAWFMSIKDHLGGASRMVPTAEEQYVVFERIVDLNVGESLVFVPSAFVAVQDEKAKKLGAVAMKMKTRARLETDGGMSVLASGSSTAGGAVAALTAQM